jgi:hypothetical protein
MHESTNHTVLDEETNMLGSSPPRPKKISSTERLKALARSSTEDTSKWTVVGDLQDEDEEEEGLVMPSSKRNSKVSIPRPIATTALNTAGTHTRDKWMTEQVKDTDDSHNTGVDAGTDDILDLTPLCSFKDRKRFSPPREILLEVSSKGNSTAQQVVPRAKESPATVLSSLQHGALNHDEEDMFAFDDPESSLQPKMMGMSPKYIEEETEEEKQTTPLVDDSDEGPPVTLYSTSPAIPIAKPASPPPASPASSVSHEMGATVGSYKGKPFILGIVNKELHKKAVEMGDLNSFVGSVDGRSGVDPSNSYRATLFDGTPRSLGVRLMEEAHARRGVDKAHKQE